MIRYIAFCLVSVFFFAACNKNKASKTPEISLINMTPDSILQGSPEDTLFINFQLKDGDADLGVDQIAQVDPSQQKYDIYVRDARNDTFTGYYFPEIDKEVLDPKKGIEGVCALTINGAFIYTRDDSLHQATGDTTHFELYIKDKAGNESNRITTGNLYIKVQ